MSSCKNRQVHFLRKRLKIGDRFNFSESPVLWPPASAKIKSVPNFSGVAAFFQPSFFASPAGTD
jgi:hypothetical protein